MNYYITTSIPYVNGDPHLGHALEFVYADVLARAARAAGSNVIFCTGTDEHGTKVAEKAESLGKTPMELATAISDQFKEMLKKLEISNDRFIRTTDPDHEKRAALIWKALEPHIYKGKYTGWYDVKQEEFVPEGQADPERMKPEHPQAYQRLEEENYFFKLSSFTKKLIEEIESDRFRVIPITRKNEILSVLKEGLTDISISRPKEKLDWGIAVPGDKNQIMYVWFEALMNYLTVLGYPEGEDFKNFWPAHVQVIGKDILRFHAAIWPAMLLGLNLPLPKQLYVHGFVTVNGQTMSKSLGNGIHPYEIVDHYGAEAFRYFFTKHIPSYGDGDFSWELFHAAYTNELANQLGNAVQRTAAMIVQYQGGLIGDMPASEHDVAAYNRALHNCQLDKAIEEVWVQVRGLNQYIDEQKPWEVAKANDEDHLREILAYQASCLLEIADLLQPFLPATALKIRQVFKDGLVHMPEKTLFPRLEPPVSIASVHTA